VADIAVFVCSHRLALHQEKNCHRSGFCKQWKLCRSNRDVIKYSEIFFPGNYISIRSDRHSTKNKIALEVIPHHVAFNVGALHRAAFSRSKILFLSCLTEYAAALI